MVRAFTIATADTLRRAIAPRLIPLMDRMRNLYTRFGLRNIRVFLVRTAWTEGNRGEGAEALLSEIEILPTPQVSDLSALQEIVRPVGQTEVGSISISGISARFTEDQLAGLDPDGAPPSGDQQFYYETETVRLDGKPGERRRFTLSGVPTLSTSGLGWTVELTRAYDASERGTLR